MRYKVTRILALTKDPVQYRKYKHNINHSCFYNKIKSRTFLMHIDVNNNVYFIIRFVLKNNNYIAKSRNLCGVMGIFNI